MRKEQADQSLKDKLVQEIASILTSQSRKTTKTWDMEQSPSKCITSVMTANQPKLKDVWIFQFG